MDNTVEILFRSWLENFLRISIDQINAFFRERWTSEIYNKVNSFRFTEQGYGYETIETLDTGIIPSLYYYHDHFRFQEAKDLAQLIIDEPIFREIDFVPPIEREVHDPDSYIAQYLVRILEDYCEMVGGFYFSKRKFNIFVTEIIKGMADDHFFCELVFVIPDLVFSRLEKGKLQVEDGFVLERASENLREQMVNDLKWEIFHSWSINYDLIISSELVLRKILRIPKDASDLGRYITSFWGTNSKIQKEIRKGMEVIKKISIYQWKLVHTSNVFYRGAPTIWLLDNTEWTSDPNFDFFAPNLIRFNRVSIRGGFSEFKKAFRKMSLFHFNNFQIPFGRYLSALNNEKKDVLNATVDYVVLFESLLLNTNTEVTFQFGLFWSLFFSRNRNDRQKTFEFFKKMYALRSDLVHGNDGNEIRKTIKKLHAIDPDWFRKLKEYGHEIILFLIKKNVQSKKELIEILTNKLHK